MAEKQPNNEAMDEFGKLGHEAGQGLAEYALILAFVALLCIGALSMLGVAISTSPGFSLF
jgi:Flp pilus assembly pilin Flp